MTQEKKLTMKASPIATSFKQIVKEAQSLADQTQHPHAIDIKMEFRSVHIDQSGIPIFSRKKNEATTEIHFATRVTALTSK